MRPNAPSGPRLWGRKAECDELDRLLVNARAGTSGALVIRGEPGIGKTALLEYLVSRAGDSRVSRAAGVESEMELAYAGLHQLVAPFLDRLDHLPPPQRDALGTAFGLRFDAPPNAFIVGLAVLSLLSDTAASEPLICLVDDAQWLDRSSAQVLGFVARRLAAESVALVFAARPSMDDRLLDGLPELLVGPIPEETASDFLASVMPGRVDRSVRDRILAESHGNPLALLELPRAWTPASFAGGFGLPDHVTVSGRIEESFRRRLETLPDDGRRLMLVAAADPVGDPKTIRAAADHLGIDADAAQAAEVAGLIDPAPQFRFRHPLVRSVVYREAEARDRQLVHAALAAVTDPDVDPDRRAWHLAAAASDPDEAIASELVSSASRAQARGGIAAAAAFLRRSVELTADPVRRSERALSASQASLQAGDFKAAYDLLATAESSPLDAFRQALVDVLRVRAGFAAGVVVDTLQLVDAADRLLRFDLELAQGAYLYAWAVVIASGPQAAADVLPQLCTAIRAIPPSTGTRGPIELLLEGLAMLTTDGRLAATPVLQDATAALAVMPADDLLRWGQMAVTASNAVWDERSQLEICTRLVQVDRDAGALSELVPSLVTLSLARAWAGDFAGAEAAIDEAQQIATATGITLQPSAALRLTCLRGRASEALPTIEFALEQYAGASHGIATTQAYWSASVLYNGLTRYTDALLAAEQATANPYEPWISTWALAELVEAAARDGQPGRAIDAFERLSAAALPSQTEFARGLAARCQALVSERPAAEALYLEAIDRLGRTDLRPELARAHLLYGEWLRLERRPADAREQLRRAHDMFADIGMEAFAERARGELRAIGDRMRKRGMRTPDLLSAQEKEIARLARDGLSNADIGAQLFLSARTVEWHLHNVFSKLGVSSRKDLRTVLPNPAKTDR